MLIYVGINPKTTTELDLSEEEYLKLPRRGSNGRAWIMDKDGKRYHVRTASCGLPHCMCALAFVK